MYPMAPIRHLLLLCGLFCLAHSYVITGATGGVNSQTGERPDRLDLRTLQTSGPAFDLYLQALVRFQEDDQNNLLSWFQVCGIHGRPFISWDQSFGNFNNGYCTHESILFPTWHRPYIALFEQIIWINAQNIAATYTANLRATYQTAAVTLRVPYWDWANIVTMPESLTSPQIVITAPSGARTVINNPLFTYRFHPKPGPPTFPTSDSVTRYPNTVRAPDSQGNSQNGLVNQRLAGNGPSLHDRTYVLLTREKLYAPFSNTRAPPNPNREDQSFDSLEAIHNEIHGITGSGGHMGFVPYAAFDPIFWLHHTNIDRLFAIWQALVPDSFVTPQQTLFGTFTTPPGSTENVNTLLTPFRGPGNGFYTSANSRYTRQFGYTYPEVRDWGRTPVQITAETLVAIKRLYDPNGRLGKRDGVPTPPLEIPDALLKNGTYRRWFLNIRVNKFALSGPFYIHFFTGKPGSDVAKWFFEPSLVGTHTVWAHENKTSQGDDTSNYEHSSIPLTRNLIAAYKGKNLTSLEPEQVAPWLTKYLNWRVAKYDDKEIPAGSVPTLEIHVVDQPVTLPAAETEFPKYGSTTSHDECTSGKPGGRGYSG